MITNSNEAKRIETRSEVDTYLDQLKYSLTNSKAKLQFQKERLTDTQRDERFTNRYTVGDLFPDEDPVDAPSGQENSVDIPVLMGGALPYTGMISILNENYEDGTHRYDDMLEDGMSCIVDYCYVNPEDLPDTPEAYATLAAEKLTDGGIYNILSVYQDDDYTESLSYPVYIVSFTSGNNEDTNFWLAFMVIRDGYTYLYAPSVSCNADYTAEELGQDLFPRLFFSDSMDN